MRTIPEVVEDIKNILHNLENTQKCDRDTVIDMVELVNEILFINSNNEREQTPMQIKEIHVDEYYCPACGSENLCNNKVVEHKFCPNCGQRIVS